MNIALQEETDGTANGQEPPHKIQGAVGGVGQLQNDINNNGVAPLGARPKVVRKI